MLFLSQGQTAETLKFNPESIRAAMQMSLLYVFIKTAATVDFLVVSKMLHINLFVNRDISEKKQGKRFKTVGITGAVYAKDTISLKRIFIGKNYAVI